MKEFTFFLVAGTAGFFVDFCIFWVFLELLGVNSARILGFLVAVNVTFLINKELTFSGKQANYPVYLLGQLKGILVNFAVFKISIHYLESPSISFIIGSAVALLFNYTFAKYLVFRKTIDVRTDQTER